MPANFRSYEGQLRLLTAVIAAHPELRLNYKGKFSGSCLFFTVNIHITSPILGEAASDSSRHCQPLRL